MLDRHSDGIRDDPVDAHDIRISALNPSLPGLEITKFKAIIVLLWPYSPSARHFALLLADPDIRSRHKQSQVRARFSARSAEALAKTGVGIGDEIILGLQGAEFTKDGRVSTPGESIDWELLYTQTLVVQAFRKGSEFANLDISDIAGLNVM